MPEQVDLHELQKLRQLEEIKRQIMSKVLEKEAFERLGRVKAVNPQMAAQAELYLLQLHQAGRLNARVNDEKMKDIFKALTEKKEFRIKRM